MRILQKAKQFTAVQIISAYADIVCQEVNKLLDDGFDIIEIRGMKYTEDDE
jgi:hypothetical protein